jgi:hypothetical protein
MIITELRLGAGRTFLWLDVAIRDIQLISFPTVQRVEEAIEGLPGEFDDLYDQLVREAVKKDRYTARLLACVVHARQTLDLRALGHAVAIDPQKSCTSYKQYCRQHRATGPSERRHITGCCGKQGVHQSGRDYFERHNSFLHNFGIDPRLARPWPTSA